MRHDPVLCTVYLQMIHHGLGMLHLASMQKYGAMIGRKAISLIIGTKPTLLGLVHFKSLSDHRLFCFFYRHHSRGIPRLFHAHSCLQRDEP